MKTNDEIRTMIENWEATTALMDDEIREEIHAKLAPCTKEEFLRAYMEAHEEEFGAGLFLCHNATRAKMPPIIDDTMKRINYIASSSTPKTGGKMSLTGRAARSRSDSADRAGPCQDGTAIANNP